MAQKIDIPLMLGYYNHVVNLPMNFFSTRKVGEIISRFRDADKIRNVISQVTLTLMIDILMSIIGGVILYMKNSKLFSLCFIPEYFAPAEPPIRFIAPLVRGMDPLESQFTQ